MEFVFRKSVERYFRCANKDWALASDLWVTFEVSSSSSEMHDVEAGAGGPPIVIIGMGVDMCSSSSR
ncbi:unnamed protein product, partial [Iphiclides podalirius]